MNAKHARKRGRAKGATRYGSSSEVESPVVPDVGLAFAERWGRLFAVGAVLVAFGLRLWHLFEIEKNDPFFSMPSVDPKVYHEWGIAIANGEAPDGVFYLSPLYPYFLGAVYRLFGADFFVARAVQVVISALSCGLVYAVGRRAFDARVGVVAALVCAAYAPTIFYDALLLPSVLQTFFMLGAVWLSLAAAEPEVPWRLLPAGASLGMAALARPNALLFGGLVLLVVLWPRRDARSRDARSMARRGLAAALFVAGLSAVVAPVTWHNYRAGEDFVLISAQGGVNFYIGNGPDANGYFMLPRQFSVAEAGNPLGQAAAFCEAAERDVGRELQPSEVSSYWYSRTFEEISKRPGRWLSLLARKMGLFFNHYEIYNSRDFTSGRDYSRVLGLPLPTLGVIGPLALLGALLAVRSGRRTHLVYGALVTFVVSLSMFFVLARYRTPAIPYLAIFAAYGAVRLVEWRALTGGRPVRILALVVAFAASAAFVNMKIAEDEQNRWAIYYNLGNNYLEMRKYRSAIAEYEKARELAPSILSVHHNLALVYEKDPRTLDQAKESWEQVLRLAQRRGDEAYIRRATAKIALMNHYLGNPSE